MTPKLWHFPIVSRSQLLPQGIVQVRDRREQALRALPRGFLRAPPDLDKGAVVRWCRQRGLGVCRSESAQARVLAPENLVLLAQSVADAVLLQQLQARRGELRRGRGTRGP